MRVSLGVSLGVSPVPSRAGRMVPGSAGAEPPPGWYLRDGGSGELYRRGRLLGEVNPALNCSLNYSPSELPPLNYPHELPPGINPPELPHELLPL